MSKVVFDVKGAKELAKQLDTVSKAGVTTKDAERQILYDIAAMILRRATQRTPVISGNLRRNYQVGSNVSDKTGDAVMHRTSDNVSLIEVTSVERQGDTCNIYVYNPVEYATYVEHGHKTRPSKEGKQRWVPGQFMLTIAANQVNGLAPAIVARRLNKILRELNR